MKRPLPFRKVAPRCVQVATWSLLISAIMQIGCESAPVDPNQKFFAAQAAERDGNHAEALRLLNEFLAVSPTTFGYLERAKVLIAMGDDEKALADCQAGLKLEPDHIDLNWCLAELKKGPGQRFKGKQAIPPSRYK